MSLLLVPASRENLEKSVEKSVDLSIARKFLSDSFISGLIKYSGLEGIRCWAMTRNRVDIFNRIQNGDEVLFTEKGTGKFTHYAIVISKTQNLELGNALWPFVGNNPWEYVYFLANVTRIDIVKSQLVQDLGYESNFKVPGVLIVNSSNFEHIGNVSSYFDIPVFDNVAEINPESDFSSENVQSTGSRRIGQQKFSKLIKENYNYACAMCGISEVEFLIAGHISAWSEDTSNRLNPKNGICLCAFHDKAFEHGYIGITDDYEIVLNQRIDHYSQLFIQLHGSIRKRITLPNTGFPDKELLKKHRAKHKLSEYGD